MKGSDITQYAGTRRHYLVLNDVLGSAQPEVRKNMVVQSASNELTLLVSS